MSWLCANCEKKLSGRKGKRFCDSICKNEYHNKMRLANAEVTQTIDGFLHRNRTILFEIYLEKRIKKYYVTKAYLTSKGFKFKYHTSSSVNSQGKTYHYIYDFRYMEFSTDQIMVVKN